MLLLLLLGAMAAHGEVPRDIESDGGERKMRTEQLLVGRLVTRADRMLVARTHARTRPATFLN